MHGTITLAHTALKNRRGRKRKQGRRSMVTGDLVKVAVDYRALAGAQPHRACLPERFRLDHRAGTVLGELLLTGRLAPHERDGKPSERALALYEAGERFSGIVRRYRAIIEAPGRARSAWHVADDEEIKKQREMEDTSRGFDCPGEAFCNLAGSCECVNRKIAYNNAHDVLECAGRLFLVTVNRVVVHDESCQAWQLPALIIGLGTLARDFGLKS